MATEAPLLLPHLFPSSFASPPPSRHHLAELRIEPAHSAVAFSAPCGKKRRCLLPLSSPRKRVLLELHPFGSPPPPSPPATSTPSRRGSPTTAPPSLSSRESDFSFFPLAGGGGGRGGGGGGNMFAFLDDAAAAAAVTTATMPTGSSASVVSFLASPGKPETPMGSTASGGFAFLASPKQPTAPMGGGSAFLASPKRSPAANAGPTANGGFAFSVAPELPLTPTGSNESGCGGASLSPKELYGISAVAPPLLPSPTPASTGSTSSGGFAFFPSPGPAYGNAASPGLAPSSPFVFSAWPARKSDGGCGGRSNSNRRTRRNLRIATPRRGSTRPRDEQEPVVTSPPQKVAKTAAGDASRSSILSGPCCSFFTSPAKSAKQESKNSSSEASRCSSPYKPAAEVTSPARTSSSVKKTITPKREVEVSSAERKAPRPSSPAVACTGAEVVVLVTCKCGVHKEFSFDHSH